VSDGVWAVREFDHTILLSLDNPTAGAWPSPEKLTLSRLASVGG
jgi:hypothetical protein